MTNLKDIGIEEFNNMTKGEKDLLVFLALQDISETVKKKCIECTTTNSVKWIWIILTALSITGLGFCGYITTRLDTHVSQSVPKD